MQDSYVWVDIETTGLNVKKDKILEVGIIITDREYAEKARTSMVIKHPASVLAQMDPWAIDTHTRNGLITESKSARYPVNIADAVLTEWLKEMVGNLAKPYMCGTSVHFDREFLKRYMPRLEACFHYRNFDLATLREFFEVNAPASFKFGSSYDVKHRAIEDIEYCLNAMRHYRQKFASMRDGSVFTALALWGIHFDSVKTDSARKG